MSDKPICARCNDPSREVEYVIQGGICEPCWIDWWVSGFREEERQEERREVEEMLADKESWPSSARDAYYEVVQEWAKYEVLSQRLRADLRRARIAGRRLAAYWKLRSQIAGDDGLKMNEYPQSPTGGYVRGRGSCSQCGLRAWKWRRNHVEKHELRCIGCGAHHGSGNVERPSPAQASEAFADQQEHRPPKGLGLRDDEQEDS